LWNNFTHAIDDPVNGDQEAQHEDRTAIGGTLNYSRRSELFGFNSELLAGVQMRYDFSEVSRTPTRDRVPIPAADNPLSFNESDQIRLGSNAVYAQATTHWTAWFRSVLGVREDYQAGSDAGTNHGTASAALFEPKVSLIFTPGDTSEFYLSAGRGFHSDDLRGVNQATITGIPGAPLIASQTGEEVGMRQTLFGGKVSATLALFNLDAESETTYDPDAGQDGAGPASRRTGYEINLTYQARRWLELYGSLSQDRARFKTPFDDGTGHVGEYLPNAPFATGSFAAYVKSLGSWSGGLEYRYLGAFPLTSDNQIQGHGYGEWNGDVRYAFSAAWNLGVSVFNLLDKKANAAEFWYIDRLPGEPAGGLAGLHVHPLEPISVRVMLSKSF